MAADYIRWLRRHIGCRKTQLVYATALIRDADGRLLFQQRTDFDWWGLPGGGVELGETFRDCVIREAAEETGWQVEPQRLVGVYAAPDWDVRYPNGDEVQQFSVGIECRIVGGHSQPDGAEATAQRFFAPHELPVSCPAWYAAMARDVWAQDATGHGAVYFDPPSGQPAGDSFLWELRRDVGTQRLIVVGCGALIRDQRGRLLFGLRSDTHDWGFIGGLMELGESPAATVVREAYEEVGIHIRPSQLAGVFTGPTFFHTYPEGNQVQVVIALFWAELESGPIIPDGEEILAAEWFEPNALPPMAARRRWMVEQVLAYPDHGLFL
jgi:8-oxo-dGTP pyrophosphatase MutT (NUDIX family)